MSPPPYHIPFWVNFLVYFGLLLGAMYLTAPAPQAIQIAYLFPLGILSFMGTNAQALMPVAYGIHIVFLVLFAIIKEIPVVYVLWVAFALYLMLNVSGCQQMLEEAGRIH